MLNPKEIKEFIVLTLVVIGLMFFA